MDRTAGGDKDISQIRGWQEHSLKIGMGMELTVESSG